MEERTGMILCGDLFTQGGADNPPITESDILGPSEAFRHGMDYFSHTPNARQMLERLAPPLAQRHSRACTAAHGAATARSYCARLLLRYVRERRPMLRFGLNRWNHLERLERRFS